MLRRFNVIIILSLSLFYYPSQTKEISSRQEYSTSSIKEIALEMIHLNESLDLLSITISNLLPEKNGQ